MTKGRSHRTLLIEVYTSPHCSRCHGASKMVESVVERMSDFRVDWQEINVLEAIDDAVRVGILKTPAIVINGDLVFSAMPTQFEFEQALLKELKSGNYGEDSMC